MAARFVCSLHSQPLSRCLHTVSHIRLFFVVVSCVCCVCACFVCCVCVLRVVVVVVVVCAGTRQAWTHCDART